MKNSAFVAWVLILSSAWVGACSPGAEQKGRPEPLAANPSKAHFPLLAGPELSAADFKPGEARRIQLSSGHEIIVQDFSNELLHQVEGTFTPEAFQRMNAHFAHLPPWERHEAILAELERVMRPLRDAGAVALFREPETAYFSLLMKYTPELMRVLKDITFHESIIINPIVYDPHALERAKAFSPATEGLKPRGSRGDTAGYSGLERIGAVEFVRQAEAYIGAGERVNGSSVKLGIVDTGITLNHPTFLSTSTGANRITYMKDFTAEGRVYFNRAAQFMAKAVDGSDEELLVSAEVIVTPKLPASPSANQFEKFEELKLKVSPEIRRLALESESGLKLGVLKEDSLQSDSDRVDINNNGKLDDTLYLLLVPGKEETGHAVYFDATGTGDFRKAKLLRDFNASSDTTTVFAETIAFHLQDEKLPDASGENDLDVVSASIVGYDPGNHGSHVAGIAAGAKTIANDRPDTLARGVAPEATILMNRVCANNGGCGATAALIDLAVNGGAEVINMSIGGLGPFNDGYGVQETVINRLTSTHNTLFVISAGNSGPGRQTVGSPSVARLSLSVGASASKTLIQRQYQWPGSGTSTETSASDDFMLFFSSRGPTAAGGFKPNVAAPGTELSAIQLNTAPGSRGGLDVYWGTSMAAPTATGAYALLLDAAKKYNRAHPDRPLSTDSTILRSVLIESARPFDVSRFDAASGTYSKGQYTWADQGKGLIDLPAAWAKLLSLRDNELPSAVTHEGKSVQLDYQVIVAGTGPNGIKYDGTRAAMEGVPAFGTGLYLDYNGKETLRQVHIARALPESYADSEQSGALTRQLLTTQDEFVLRTIYYGSNKAWLRVGVMDELDCAQSETANLTVLGRGVEITVNKDGTGALNPSGASALNVCLNRQMISEELPQGDNGALIEAYRVVNGRVATLPSFTVPVFVTVPHRVLSGAKSYESTRVVPSFGVDRNYVEIPEGTSAVQVTLEVPALQAGESCSGVELMALVGGNTERAIPSRAKSRAFNCNASGAPTPEASRKVTFTRANPKPGVWDLHVFGWYKYARSNYTLRVDYVRAVSSIEKIEGDIAELNGSFTWSLKESSLSVTPDSALSAYVLNGLHDQVQGQVENKKHVIVEGALGVMRSYPAEVKSVTITTGGSPGNDIDLVVLECAAEATDADHESCEGVASSGTSSDVEKASFTPVAGMLYAVRVDGYEIKDVGGFDSGETLEFGEEQGTVSISGSDPEYLIAYLFSEEARARSVLFKHALFTTGSYDIVGNLTLNSSSNVPLASIPVTIHSTPAP